MRGPVPHTADGRRVAGVAACSRGLAYHTVLESGSRVPVESASAERSLTDAGNNIDSGSTCGLNGPGSWSNTNPKLGVLANNGGPTRTMALLSGSPAINAGSSPAPAVDQRGVKRGAKPDIGAFEVAGQG